MFAQALYIFRVGLGSIRSCARRTRPAGESGSLPMWCCRHADRRTDSLCRPNNNVWIVGGGGGGGGGASARDPKTEGEGESKQSQSGHSCGHWQLQKEWTQFGLVRVDREGGRQDMADWSANSGEKATTTKR